MKLTDARILFVDDEPILLELFENWLRMIGCDKVFTAANGKDALSLLQLESFDLLVSDVRMPVMDGITLVRCLSEVAKPLPSIIFVSGFSDFDRREMYALGVEAFLIKPFDRAELLSRMEKAVAERSTLWNTEMDSTPLQSLFIKANRMDKTASLNTIGLGRGGFSIYAPEPLSPGKATFRLVLAEYAIEIAGQGYVRWSSQTDRKAGVELAFLNPECHALLAGAIASACPRSFIPGS